MKTLTIHTANYLPMLERTWAGICVFSNLDKQDTVLGDVILGDMM